MKRRTKGEDVYFEAEGLSVRWQLIPHAGGRLSRQADQKVKAPGGPLFEMGMGPRYQTENISKLPATERLHIHGTGVTGSGGRPIFTRARALWTLIKRSVRSDQRHATLSSILAIST